MFNLSLMKHLADVLESNKYENFFFNVALPFLVQLVTFFSASVHFSLCPVSSLFVCLFVCLFDCFFVVVM